VGQLAQVLFHGSDDLIGMLAFYGDGSGEHGKGTSKIFVLAGYLAHTLDWFEIERHWVRILQEAPEIEYFKARECIRHQGEFSGQFKGWDQEAVEEKRLKLAEIIRGHSDRMVQISSTVRWDEYDSAMGDDAFRRVFYHPYHLCFHGVSSLAIESANQDFRDKQSRVAFVFDTEGKKLDQSLEVHYGYAHGTLPKWATDRLGSVTWCTDLHFPMLQVADLLAWSIRSEREGLPSPVMNVICDKTRIAAVHDRRWNPSGLAQFVIDKEEDFYKQFPDARIVR
jgi:hypothetical protein